MDFYELFRWLLFLIYIYLIICPLFIFTYFFIFFFIPKILCTVATY